MSKQRESCTSYVCWVSACWYPLQAKCTAYSVNPGYCQVRRYRSVATCMHECSIVDDTKEFSSMAKNCRGFPGVVKFLPNAVQLLVQQRQAARTNLNFREKMAVIKNYDPTSHQIKKARNNFLPAGGSCNLNNGHEVPKTRPRKWALKLPCNGVFWESMVSHCNGYLLN